jgi:predicted dehydrogenase
MKKISLSIIGCGARGSGTYAEMALTKFKDRCEIVAIAEPDDERRKLLQNRCHLPDKRCFKTGDDLLKEDRLSDALIIATMDQQHVGYAIGALQKGYDLLLEKPISPSLHECLRLEDEYQKHQQNVVVCHVLRYNIFYGAIKRLLAEGKLGEIINVEASENVGYWHMAHSFVRGNWCCAEDSSPMILQKSCHDMDIFVWLFGSGCRQISSLGSLRVFRQDKAPKGATLRCLDCPLKDCIFDARKIYLTNPGTGFEQGNRGWPIVPYLTPICTRERILAALKDGPYGRCVYHCDNDVVDHQTSLIEMSNGVLISFTMSAFSEQPHRMIKIMGTQGSLSGDDAETELIYRDFKKGSVERIPLASEAHNQGHGGGDLGLFEDFLDVEEGKPRPDNLTSLPVSLESHYMAFAAEKSRLAGGAPIRIDEMKKEHSAD